MIKEITLYNFDKQEKQIQSNLRKFGCVLIRNVPIDDNNKILAKIAEKIGRPTGVSIASHLVEDNYIHLVQALQTPEVNSIGFEVLSTGRKQFDLHTDEYFAKKPADVLMFHCVRPDKSGGGKSYVSFLKDIIRKLEPGMLKTLRKKQFPHPVQLVPIISGPHSDPLIRFNPYEISNYYAYLNEEMPEDMSKAISSLHNAANEVAIEFSLKEKDCLVIDNRKVLHGRSRFSSKSNRLLKRIRLFKIKQ